MQDWIQIQKESSHHRAALILFPSILFLGFFHPVISAIGMVIFFLVTSFRLLKTMLMYMLILGGISALIPPLAPIILIIMIVLFIMRIGFVIKNWKPFVAGIFIYGSAGGIIAKISTEPYLWLSSYFSTSVFLEALTVALIGCFVLRAILVWLYRQGYTSSSALGIMGSAPLIIISFILPFLKMHIGGDFFGHDAAFTDGHVMTGGDHIAPNGHMLSNSDTVLPSSQSGAVNSSDLQHVQAHVRTAPDGDPTNNFSYHGPDAKPVYTQHLVQVHDYVRTAPDGDPTNNFSYHGRDAKPVNTQHLVQVHDYVRKAPDGVSNHVQLPANVNQGDADYIIPDIITPIIAASGAKNDKMTKVKEISDTNAVGQTAVDRLVTQLNANDGKAF
ncbi:hypothetical protein RCG23_13650 [Neobacillus sp. PS3-34]|uniref:hypothetical protein n=1 Tax=Neobacillus sp. PS3-34 TaxID=3070678 RepID=UPI0027E18DFB|nr:hypothetical protein [Neobacillus sp. PS3-34]WML46693.1 hypothetical protein RCG23_13650 [Neobacillus sp. PS3-34]